MIHYNKHGSMIIFIRIKQYRSKISSSVHKKLINSKAKLKKHVAHKKKCKFLNILTQYWYTFNNILSWYFHSKISKQ